MKAFINLVASMRDAQKKYRDSHQLDDLKARRRFERAVDMAVAESLAFYDTPISKAWLLRNSFTPTSASWSKSVSNGDIRLYEICDGDLGWLLIVRSDGGGWSHEIIKTVFNAGEVQDALLAIGLSIPIKQ